MSKVTGNNVKCQIWWKKLQCALQSFSKKGLIIWRNLHAMNVWLKCIREGLRPHYMMKKIVFRSNEILRLRCFRYSWIFNTLPWQDKPLTIFLFNIHKRNFMIRKVEKMKILKQLVFSYILFPYAEIYPCTFQISWNSILQSRYN